jgi:hypothetical protein
MCWKIRNREDSQRSGRSIDIVRPISCMIDAGRATFVEEINVGDATRNVRVAIHSAAVAGSLKNAAWHPAVLNN